MEQEEQEKNLLEAIYSHILNIEKDMGAMKKKMKEEMGVMKEEMGVMKEEMGGRFLNIEKEMGVMREDINFFNEKIIVDLALEKVKKNETLLV